MKISSIRIKNFMAIQSFEIDKAGKFVLLTGQNGAGKSSFIQALKLQSETAKQPVRLIHDGTDKATILIEFDSGHTCETTITEKSGARTRLLKADGELIPGPKAWLEKQFGVCPVNPIEFCLPRPGESDTDLAKRQRITLLNALPISVTAEDLAARLEKVTGFACGSMVGEAADEGVDFSQHGLEVVEQLAGIVHERRRTVNADKTTLEKTITSLSADVPSDFDPDLLNFDLESANNEVIAAGAAVAENERQKSRMVELRDQVDTLIAEIEALEAQIKAKEERIGRLNEEGKQLKIAVAAFEPVDVESLKLKIRAAQAARESAGSVKQVAAKREELLQITERHTRLDSIYKALVRDIPSQLLSEQKLPVEGLSVSDDAVLYNGRPLADLSEGEKLRFAAGLPKLFGGNFEVVILDGLQDLDPKQFKAFLEEASKDNYQYVLTRVVTAEEMERTGGQLSCLTGNTLEA